MVLDRSRQKHNCLLCCYSSLRQTCCRPNLYITKRGSVQNINNIRKNRPLTSPDVPRIEPERLMGQFHVSLRAIAAEKQSYYPTLLVYILSVLLQVSAVLKALYKSLLDGLYRVIQHAIAEHDTRTQIKPYANSKTPPAPKAALVSEGMVSAN